MRSLQVRDGRTRQRTIEVGARGQTPPRPFLALDCPATRLFRTTRDDLIPLLALSPSTLALNSCDVCSDPSCMTCAFMSPTVRRCPRSISFLTFLDLRHRSDDIKDKKQSALSRAEYGARRMQFGVVLASHIHLNMGSTWSIVSCSDPASSATASILHREASLVFSMQ